MKPKFVNLDSLNIVGVQVAGSPADGSFGKTWPVLFERNSELPSKVGMDVAYGVQSYSKELMKQGQWKYTAGLEVSKTDNIPDGMELISVPSNQYAVFEYKGVVGPELGELFQNIYKQWLPNSGYELAGEYDFERYDSRFKGPANPESVLDIYVPVKKPRI
ncbi:GyrI-like domain-containing protein [Gilvimarinus sp. SDUM040013]|uniref:GyrI-like domain-containing protein n=1 Tax=Gilvimarinus gilvus TaxID=3058038 RepID=A0ABU4RSD3_9GAMM|nr:GyrI-like domain-containing protein [Gilvimarinus sp. SDUM040013]MDO3388250.1 GyrI-like domain-containing protein [Gilvimarinus sp. SDUM040013]MDX6847800.1 GyrI-like domain-containing protein [Gilvimarinus sp. SDUM040013]